MKVIRKLDSRVFLDGPEVCREYVVTPKDYLWFLYPAAGTDRRH